MGQNREAAGVAVTIPECMNPFVVNINGVEYSYPAGTEQVVPEEVAEVIEQHMDAVPKPDGDAGIAIGGGMVVHITAVATMEVEAGPQYAADKTYDEIMGAIHSGSNVIAILQNPEGFDVFLVTYFTSEFVSFSTFYLDPYGNFGSVMIGANGHVEIRGMGA